MTKSDNYLKDEYLVIIQKTNFDMKRYEATIWDDRGFKGACNSTNLFFLKRKVKKLIKSLELPKVALVEEYYIPKGKNND